MLVLSNSVVATIGFTIEDKHLIGWLWESEKCDAECLIKTFADRGLNFGALKHWSEKMTEIALIHVRVVVDRTLPAQQQILTKL